MLIKAIDLNIVQTIKYKLRNHSEYIAATNCGNIFLIITSWCNFFWWYSASGIVKYQQVAIYIHCISANNYRYASVGGQRTYEWRG